MSVTLREIDLNRVDLIIDRSDSDPEALIGILQDIQAEWKYLPLSALKRVAERLNINPNRVWAVATFYEAFTLEPRGRIHIQVCTGTACHVRNASEIVRALEDALMIEAGHTTADGEFSLETAHCLGACAMGPIMVVREKYHGHLTRTKALDILSRLRDARGDDD